MPAPAPPAPPREEIVRYFDAFVAAFATFRGAEVAKLYLVPGVALRGDGSVRCLQSSAEIAAFFQAALDGYARDGGRAVRYTDLEVLPLGGRSVVGTVTWQVLGDGGRIVKEWRQSYNLVRGDAGGWQALASTYHMPAADPS